MTKSSRYRALVAALVATFAAPAIQASVVLNGTRIVYPESEAEVTLKLTNEGESPSLVQAWIDDGNLNASPEETNAPFMLAPPLFRLDGNKGQTLRIVYLGSPLQKDRESLFWLNVLDVPPMATADGSTSANSLQLAIRTRIKLMFRPRGLPGDPSSAPYHAAWQLLRKDDGKLVLTATNPTPYHVTYTMVEARAQGKIFSNDAGAMAAPGQTIEFPLDDSPGVSGEPDEVRFAIIDDNGASVEGLHRRGGTSSAVTR